DSPVYDFSTQFLEERRPFSDPANITVMAIDNLPSELPRNASESFGDQLMSHVIPALAKDINSDLLTRATIAQNGKLMPSFEYLSDYAFGTKIE
ncbi:MAG: alanine dehydrogenase, partial [Cyclobacteriaceae bacterium]